VADKELSELEADIEATRTRLAATIDQLAYRTSPKTIARREMSAVKGYFVDETGSPRTDHVVRVAGGVAAAVVLYVVLRKITH